MLQVAAKSFGALLTMHRQIPACGKRMYALVLVLYFVKSVMKGHKQ